MRRDDTAPGFALDSFCRRGLPRCNPVRRTSFPPALLVLAAAFVFFAGNVWAEKIDLGAGKSVRLVLPESWKASDTPLPSDAMPAAAHSVRYVTRSGSNDALFISILPDQEERFADRENLKEMVEHATEQFVADSVEGKADLKEIRVGGATGFAVTFTDANLVGKPSEKENYKAITCCFVSLGGKLMVTATIFTDDVGGKAYAEAMHILKSLSLELPGTAL